MRVMKHFLLWHLGMAQAWTSRTAAECQCLARHAAGKKRLVEIGCWYGVNTRRLRRAMAPDGVLFGVDPYAPGRLGFSAIRYIAHREVAKCPNGRMCWVQATDVEAARAFVATGEAPVDFVFTDAVFTYEASRQTWESWSPLVAPGGVMVLADTHSSATRQLDHLGSVQFTRDAVLRDPRFELVEVVDTLTVMRRRGEW